MIRLVSLSRNLGKVCLGFMLGVSMTACVDKSLYETSVDPDGYMPGEAPNSFDFSTVQKVNLNVDYSAFKTYGPVFFGVYTENPIIVVEDAPDDQWNENVKAIYEDYTESNGKFNAAIELPAYAQHLYIATGNFFTGMMVMEADVKNGVASVVAENQQVVAARGGTRAEGPGVSTDDLSALNLTNTVDDNGNLTDEKLYNDWKNWLGTWNSASGRPDYLLNKATADPKLVISEEEMEGLYAAVGTAFTSGSTMNLVELAAQGLGATFLSSSTRPQYLHRMHRFMIEGISDLEVLKISWLRTHYLSAPAKRFIALAQETLPKSTALPEPGPGLY